MHLKNIMQSKIYFKNISIIGLGLIGGSVSKAIQKKYPNVKITAFDINQTTINEAAKEGIISNIKNDLNITKNADLVIISSPIKTYEHIFNKIKSYIKKDCIIIDIGSVKQPVIDIAAKILSKEQIANFIPCHPIAGSEKSGFKASSEEILFDKKCIITPGQNIDNKSLDKIISFWQDLKMQPQIMHPNKHDQIYAEISHLPQLLCFAYHNILEKNETFITDENDILFQKFSRLKNSNKKLWSDIFIANKLNLYKNISSFIDSLKFILQNFNKDTLKNSLLSAQKNISNIEEYEKIQTSETKHNIFNFNIAIILNIILANQITNIDLIGSGYKDFSNILISADENFISSSIKHKNDIISFLNHFIIQLNYISDKIVEDEYNLLEKEI